jgi:hypothetical protein
MQIDGRQDEAFGIATPVLAGATRFGQLTGKVRRAEPFSPNERAIGKAKALSSDRRAAIGRGPVQAAAEAPQSIAPDVAAIGLEERANKSVRSAGVDR